MNKWLDSTIKTYERYVGLTHRPVVWEIGSRDGHDGVELAKRIYNGLDDWFWTNTTVVCFEPNPDQAKIIKKNYPEVRVVEMAASNKTGKADFKVYHGNEGDVGSSSLNLDWKEDDLEGHVIKVKTIRLEEYIKDYEKIGIMKIDVEGHSLEVLEGLEDKLNQVMVIHVETETWTGSDKAVEEFMKTRGWTLVDVAEEWGGMPDQVWVNSAVLSD